MSVRLGDDLVAAIVHGLIGGADEPCGGLAAITANNLVTHSLGGAKEVIVFLDALGAALAGRVETHDGVGEFVHPASLGVDFAEESVVEFGSHGGG